MVVYLIYCLCFFIQTEGEHLPSIYNYQNLSLYVNEIVSMDSFGSSESVEQILSDLSPKRKKSSKIEYIFHSREHLGGVPISPSNSSSELFSLFRPDLQTKVIIHGYQGGPDDTLILLLVGGWLLAREVNLIVVDWSQLARRLYPGTLSAVTTVGKSLSELIVALVAARATSIYQIHLVGYSLGAHVAGSTGHFLQGRIYRITGLDPAGPGFYGVSKETVLDRTDAQFVDILHTSRLCLQEPHGHADFYPNGQPLLQPGCPDSSLTFYDAIVGYCSHRRSVFFFIESLINRNGFRSVQCDSWSNFTRGRCANRPVAYMGDPASPESRGKYYLKTNSRYLFGKG